MNTLLRIRARSRICGDESNAETICKKADARVYLKEKEERSD